MELCVTRSGASRERMNRAGGRERPGAVAASMDLRARRAGDGRFAGGKASPSMAPGSPLAASAAAIPRRRSVPPPDVLLALPGAQLGCRDRHSSSLAPHCMTHIPEERLRVKRDVHVRWLAPGRVPHSYPGEGGSLSRGT